MILQPWWPLVIGRSTLLVQVKSLPSSPSWPKTARYCALRPTRTDGHGGWSSTSTGASFTHTWLRTVEAANKPISAGGLLIQDNAS
jgi:hypothetical protein